MQLGLTGQILECAGSVEYKIRCMSRTNVNIDDEACAEIMRRYQLPTKRMAINFALRTLAEKPLDIEEARRLRGSGWEGSLDKLRDNRLA